MPHSHRTKRKQAEEIGIEFGMPMYFFSQLSKR